MKGKTWGLLFIVFFVCAAGPLNADATDDAISKIRQCTKEAVAEIEELTTKAEGIRTVEAAVDSLDRFYAIISRMINEVNIVDKELGAKADTKKLLASITEIKKQTAQAGAAYGAALGKLPQVILSADDFMAAVKKLNNTLLELNTMLPQ